MKLKPDIVNIRFFCIAISGRDNPPEPEIDSILLYQEDILFPQ